MVEHAAGLHGARVALVIVRQPSAEAVAKEQIDFSELLRRVCGLISGASAPFVFEQEGTIEFVFEVSV